MDDKGVVKKPRAAKSQADRARKKFRESVMKELINAIGEELADQVLSKSTWKSELEESIQTPDVLENYAEAVGNESVLINGAEIEVNKLKYLTVEGVKDSINVIPYLIAFNVDMYKLIEYVDEIAVSKYGGKAGSKCLYTFAGIQKTLTRIYGCKKDELTNYVLQDLLSLLDKEEYKMLELFRSMDLEPYSKLLPYYIALSKYPAEFFATTYSSIKFLEENTLMELETERSIRSALSLLQGLNHGENTLLCALLIIQNMWYLSVNKVAELKAAHNDHTLVVVEESQIEKMDARILRYLKGEISFRDLYKEYHKELMGIDFSLRNNLYMLTKGPTDVDPEHKEYFMKLMTYEYGKPFGLEVSSAINSLLKSNHTEIAKAVKKSQKNVAKLEADLLSASDKNRKSRERELELEREVKSLKKLLDSTPNEDSNTDNSIGNERDMPDNELMLHVEIENLTKRVEDLTEANKRILAEKSDSESLERARLKTLENVIKVYGINESDIECLTAVDDQATNTSEDTGEPDISLDEIIEILNEFKIVICGGPHSFVERLEKRGLTSLSHIDSVSRKSTTYDAYMFRTDAISHTVMWNLDNKAKSQNAKVGYISGTNVDKAIYAIYKALQ